MDRSIFEKIRGRGRNTNQGKERKTRASKLKTWQTRKRQGYEHLCGPGPPGGKKKGVAIQELGRVRSGRTRNQSGSAHREVNWSADSRPPPICSRFLLLRP